MRLSPPPRTAPLHVGINAQLLRLGQNYRSAGITTYCYQLLRHLPQVSDNRYTIWTGEAGGEIAGVERRLTTLPTQRPAVRILWEQALQPIEVAQSRADLLHGLAFVLPLINTIPALITIYDLSFYKVPQAFNVLNRLYLQTMTRVSVRRARHVCAIAEHGRQDIIQQFGISPTRVSVVYPGLDPRFASPPSATEVAAFRERKGLPEHFILFLGTLEPRKNLPMLVRAYAALRRTLPDVHLILAGGKGWGFDEIFAEVERLGVQDVVHFPGFVESAEQALWYASADLFVYPSQYEGFGLPPLEAMACGTPVITSNATSLTEVVGKAGIALPPNEQQAFTAAMHTILTSPTEQAGYCAAGLEQARRFSWMESARVQTQIYQHVAQGGGMNRAWATLLERGWLRWVLVGLDVLLIQLAFFTAWYLRYELELGGTIEPQSFTAYSLYIPPILVLTGLMLFNLTVAGLYRLRRAATWFDELYGILNATTTSVLLVIVFFFFSQNYAYSRLVYAYTAALLVLYLGLARLAVRLWLSWLRKRDVGVTRIIIVGAGEAGRTLMRHIVAQPELGYKIMGFVDDDPARQQDFGSFPALGSTQDVTRLVRTKKIDKVIITLPWEAQRKIVSIIQECQKLGVEFRVVPDFIQVSLTQVTFDEVKGVPLIGLAAPRLKGINLAFKRIVDVIIAVPVALVFAPILALVALAVRLESPGPAIFKQVRIGRDGNPFLVYKFRSMRSGAEGEKERLRAVNEDNGPRFKIRQDPRITRVGRFIRRTSLDEFPQIWNVLRGEMSVIGPRPALPEEVEQYEEWHRKRLEAPPGLTGLWQVSGRSNVTFDEMMLLDIYYVERWSPLLDLMILLRTIPAVLLQRGAF